MQISLRFKPAEAGTAAGAGAWAGAGAGAGGGTGPGAGGEADEATLMVDPGRWTQLGYDDVWDFQPLAQANACTTLAAMIHKSAVKKVSGWVLFGAQCSDS